MSLCCPDLLATLAGKWRLTTVLAWVSVVLPRFQARPYYLDIEAPFNPNTPHTVSSDAPRPFSVRAAPCAHCDLWQPRSRQANNPATATRPYAAGEVPI